MSASEYLPRHGEDVDSPQAPLDPLEADLKRFGRPLFFHPKSGVPKELNERYLAAHFSRSQHVCFDPIADSFYRYEGDTGLWKRRDEHAIREALAEHIMTYGAARGISLDALMTTRRLNPVVQALRGIIGQWEAPTKARDFVHVSNGVVRFQKDGTVKLTEFRMEDYSRNRSPLKYVEGATCPRFMAELLNPALCQEDANLLQRFAGNVVAGVNPCQRMLILDGDSGTGKSTLAAILRHLAGPENSVQLRTAFLDERFEAFRFVDKSFLTAPDVKGDFLNHKGASNLKSLVGDDDLTAEGKSSNTSFAIKGRYNVLITANTRLRIKLDGDKGAWRRRLTIIRFKNPPPPRNVPHFGDVLMAEEGSGILNWALEGFRQAHNEVLVGGDLIFTPRQVGWVDSILMESDSVAYFVQQCTVKGAGDLSSASLAEAYYAYCAKLDWTPEKRTIYEEAAYAAMLKIHGVSRSNDLCVGESYTVRGWHGVTMRLPIS